MTILTIQSHVAIGHVGLEAATLPLQRLGFDVAAVPTVIYSNHPGHGSFRGIALSGGDLEDILNGIIEHGALATIRAVHSGYLDSVDQAKAVWGFVQKMRAARNFAPYFCDPVMGDREKGLYVSEDVASFFRNKAAETAEALFPNHFELEYLVGNPVTSLGSALAAADSLRSRGARAVIATSLKLTDQFPEGLCTLAVADEGAYLGAVPYLANAPKGAGDLFAAIFIARSMKHEPLANTLSLALTSTHRILESSVRANAAELHIVEGQDFICKPGNPVAVTKVR
jgi:pyridoxine kinase